MPDYDYEAVRARMRKVRDEVCAALDGEFADQYRELRGLDPEVIRAITPDTTDEAVYEELLEVVRHASATNMAQAQLKQRIIEMGKVAVEIASRVPSIAKMFMAPGL